MYNVEWLNIIALSIVIAIGVLAADLIKGVLSFVVRMIKKLIK